MAINNMWHGVLIMAEIVNQWRNGVSNNQSAGSYHISGVINQRGGGVMAYNNVMASMAIISAGVIWQRNINQRKRGGVNVMHGVMA
jgi:hypothetical protein